MTKIVTQDGTHLATFDANGLCIHFDGKVVLRFEKTGVILVGGVVVALNQKAVYGLREFLKNLESGNFKEIE